MQLSGTQKKTFIFLVASLVTVLLFFPFASESLWWRQALNSGHTVFFFVLSFFLYQRLIKVPRWSETHTVFLLVFVACLVLGAGIELLQGYFQKALQREASWDDFYKDIFGVIAGLALVTFTLQKKVPYKLFSALIVFVFLMSGLFSLSQLSWHGIKRLNALPLLTQFDQPWSASFVNLRQVVMSDVIEDQGVNWHRMRFDKAEYPGIDIIEPVQDWRQYSKLSFKVWSHNQNNVSLTFRVHDDQHNQEYNDRFNQSFVIQQGMNNISIGLADIKHAPETRVLNMGKVSGVQLFMVEVKERLFLDISNLYFE
jgi:hypothetical protein